MSLSDYQDQINENVKGLAKPYWHPLSQLARLSEEVGELARILNHKYGDKPKKPSEKHADLGDEIADIIYTVLCLANSQNIQLDNYMTRTIDKLIVRDKNRFQKKAKS